MSKGIEYILTVIDRATEPFRKLYGNIDGASASFDKFKKDASSKMGDITKSAEKAGSGIGAAFAKAKETATDHLNQIGSKTDVLLNKGFGSLNNAAQMAIGAKHREQGLGIRAKTKEVIETVRQFSIKDFATAKLQQIKDRFAAIKDKVAGFSIKDYATAKLLPIQQKIAAVKDKVAGFSIKDYATAKLLPIQQKIAAVKDKVVGFSIKDYATAKLLPIQQKIAAVKDKVAEISIRDMASGALTRIIGSANNATHALLGLRSAAPSLGIRDRVSANVNKIKSNLGGLKDKMLRLNVRDMASGVVARVKTGLSGLRDKTVRIHTEGGGLFGKAGGLLNMIGGPLIAGGISIGALLGGAISKGMENDLQKTNITTLMRGNVEKANQLFSELSDYSIKTPYEKADVIDAQKTMMSFGLESEAAFGKLRNIGDIAMGDAGKMKSLTLAFAQATSAGKLQGQDLLQMINAGFNPLQVISERTGESMASLKDRMAKGGISAKELAGAFEMATDSQGLFYRGAEKASETFAGKVSNLKDAVSEGLISVYEKLKPMLMPLIDAMIGGVGKMAGFVIKIFDSVKSAIAWVWNKIKEGSPIILALTAVMAGFATQMLVSKLITLGMAGASAVATAAQWALNAAMTANPIGLVIAGVIALIGLIAYLIYRYDGWGAAWQNLVSFLDNSWQLFKQVFITTWLQTENVFLTGIEKLKVAWLSFKSLWDADAAAAGMAKIADDQQSRMKAIADSRQKEATFSANAANAWQGIELKKNNKTWSDAVGSIKEKLIPKTGAAAVAADLSKESSKTKRATQKDEEAGKKAAGAGAGRAKGINEGGSRPTTINITIGKLQDQLIVNAGNLKEAAKQAGNDVVNELLMALNSVDKKGGAAYE
jgi:tape measure domain-containing protein